MRNDDGEFPDSRDPNNPEVKLLKTIALPSSVWKFPIVTVKNFIIDSEEFDSIVGKHVTTY